MTRIVTTRRQALRATLLLLLSAAIAAAADRPGTTPSTAPADRIDALIADLADDAKHIAAADELVKVGPPAAVRLAAAAGAIGKDFRVTSRALGVLNRIGAPAVLPLARAWDAGDPDAVMGLAALVEDAAPAIPIAIARLRHADPHERSSAADVLGRIGQPAAVDGEGALAGVLKADPEPRVRSNAAAALGKLRLPPDRLVRYLAPALEDPSSDVRPTAAYGLRGAGRAAAPFAARLQAILLNDGYRGEPHYHVCPTLGAIGTPVMSAMAELLKNPKPAHRQAALEVLSVARHESAPLLPAVTALLADPDPKTRAAAAAAIGKMGRAARPAVRAVAALLADPDGDTRQMAAHALKSLGPVAAEAVPALRAALRGPDLELRNVAYWAFQYIGPAAADAVPDLLPTVDLAFARPPTAPATTRPAADPVAAIHTLGYLGPAAARAASGRLARLARGDGGPAAQSAAIGAVSKLGPAAAAAAPELVPTMLMLIDGPRRKDAIVALWMMGPAAKPAAPALVRILGGADADAAAYAASALRAVGAADAASLAALDAAARRPEPFVRLSAVAAAARLRRDAPAAARACAVVLRGPDARDAGKDDAYVVLDEMKAEPAAAVPELTAGLAATDLSIVPGTSLTLAIFAMSAVDPAARAVTRAALEHPNPTLRFMAHERLAEIGEPATRPGVR